MKLTYVYLQNKSSLWPSEEPMTCMCSAISDLSCYITVQSHCLQTTGQEGMRAWVEGAWLAPSCYFPTRTQNPEPRAVRTTEPSLTLTPGSAWPWKENFTSQPTCPQTTILSDFPTWNVKFLYFTYRNLWTDIHTWHMKIVMFRMWTSQPRYFLQCIWNSLHFPYKNLMGIGDMK